MDLIQEARRLGLQTLRGSHVGAALAAVAVLAACTSRRNAPPEEENPAVRATAAAPAPTAHSGEPGPAVEPPASAATPSSFDPTRGGFTLFAQLEQKENLQHHRIHVGNADEAARLRCTLQADALHCPADASPCEIRSEQITTGTIPPRKARRITREVLQAELPARIEWVRLAFPFSCSFERQGGEAAGSVELRSEIAGNGSSATLSIEHDGRGRPGTELNCRGSVERTVESESGEAASSVTPFEITSIRDGARGEATLEAEEGSRLTALRLLLPLRCWYSPATG